MANYLFAITHSPTYRIRYEQQLKEDFPRIPLPKAPALFQSLHVLGKQISKVYRLQYHNDEGFSSSTDINKPNTLFPENIRNMEIGGFQVLKKQPKSLTKEDEYNLLKHLMALGHLQAQIDFEIKKHLGWPEAFYKID